MRADLDAAPTGLTGWRGVLRPVAVAGAAAVAVTVVALVDPNESGHYPTCPFLAVTGLYCPGCGTLRAVHDLAHGDLTGAMARNPMTVAATGLAIVSLVLWFRRAWRGAPRSYDPSPRVLYTAAILVVAFTVLRNVPGWTWLSPA